MTPPNPDAPALPRNRWAGRLLQVAGGLTLFVAVFHAVAMVWPGVSEPSPVWRHGLFVFVNLFFAWGFLTRASWLPVPFAILTAQQVYSHGADFLRARAVGHTDEQSVAVLLSLPCLALLVAFGRKRPP